MSDGTTCPPPESGRKSTLTSLVVTIILSALAAYGANTLIEHYLDLGGWISEAVRLFVTLAAVVAGIMLLRLYRRRPPRQ